jgi:hypothetical protein
MKYRFEHMFDCDPETLLRTMFEQNVTETLRPGLTRIMEAETLEWTQTPGGIKRRVRYLPVPKINSVGPKKVEPRWMEWVEESEVDFARGTGRYVNLPTTPRVAELLKNSGDVSCERLGPGRTRRILTGELRVEVFLLGIVAERLIHAYAKEIVDEEAGALARLVRERGAK